MSDRSTYTIKTSSAYIRAVLITGCIVMVPGCIFISVLSLYGMPYSTINSIILLSLCLCSPVIMYISIRYQLGKTIFSDSGIIVTSHIARKLNFNWNEIVSFGATAKVIKNLCPANIIIYFSKIPLTAYKAHRKAPTIRKNIYFIVVNDDILRKAKQYIPKNMYEKIIFDMILMKYPVPPDLL